MKGWSPVGGGTKLGGWEDGGNVGDSEGGQAGLIDDGDREAECNVPTSDTK